MRKACKEAKEFGLKQMKSWMSPESGITPAAREEKRLVESTSHSAVSDEETGVNSMRATENAVLRRR